MIKYSRVVILLVLDAICVNISYIAAFLLRFDFEVSAVFYSWFEAYVNSILWVTLIQLAVFWLFGLYNSLWKYAGTEEILKVAAGSVAGGMAVIVYLEAVQDKFPRSVYIYAICLNMLLIGGIRLFYRIIRDHRHPGNFNVYAMRHTGRRAPLENGTQTSKVMLVGAGDAGASIIKEIRQHPEYNRKVVVAVDDNPTKKNRRIAGVKIAGGREDIRRLARKYGVDEIVIAIPSAKKKETQEIVNECNKTRCKLKILPGLSDLINGKVSISRLRDVDIEDLLGREPVQVNWKEITSYLEGRIVMVTGGGGTIGSELCRQIAEFRPRKLIAVDIYENTVFELKNEMKRLYPYIEFEVTIASIRDQRRLEELFIKYKPHVIFHAGAHKHVPLMEENPKEAIVNNVLGTKYMVDLADRYAVEKFVLISTDKAVNPANVMGATKRICEMILQDKSAHSRTSYSAVRFGNVLGSNGSVIPIFRKQIEQGGPVTVTHPDIRRYFMIIPEAVQLVIQAGAMAQGGEIFILDMGEPVRIMDLAENIIRLSGYIPHVDIDIVISGLRPGEKLYEELLLDEEGMKQTEHNKIYVGHPIKPPAELEQLLAGGGSEKLETSVSKVAAGTEDEARQWLHRMVPNYQENGGK